MYKAIAWELGLPTQRSREPIGHPGRTTRLVCEAKQLPVLVIDEAQHLRNDVLEDLRLLCNFAMDSDNRLCRSSSDSSCAAASPWPCERSHSASSCDTTSALDPRNSTSPTA